MPAVNPSAAFGYRVGRPVAFAYIDQDCAQDGIKVTVNIAGDLADAVVVDGTVFRF